MIDAIGSIVLAIAAAGAVAYVLAWGIVRVCDALGIVYSVSGEERRHRGDPPAKFGR